MIKNILVIIFILASTITGSSQGLEFFHGTWEETLDKAKAENKIIFVDSYTTWCGPCRRMQKNIFPLKQAGDVYNKHFINVKMNMETQEGMKFGMTYPVGAYPTLYYIDPDGKVVLKKVGGQHLDGFLELAKKALKSYDQSPDLAVEWEKGNRNYNFVLKYIKALNNADKPTNKVALQYLREKKNLDKDRKAVLLFEATNECDSKLFEMMTEKKYLKLIKQIYSEREIAEKIYNACWKTFEKSLEYEVEELGDEAKKKMKKYNKKQYKEFVKKIDLVKAENENDIDKYIKAAKKYFKTLSDSNGKLSFVDSISKKFKGNDKIKSLVEELAEKTFLKDKTPKTYQNYIKILINHDKKSLAIKHLGKAIKMAEDMKDDNTLRTLKRYERYLQKAK